MCVYFVRVCYGECCVQKMWVYEGVRNTWDRGGWGRVICQVLIEWGNVKNIEVGIFVMNWLLFLFVCGGIIKYGGVHGKVRKNG